MRCLVGGDGHRFVVSCSSRLLVVPIHPSRKYRRSLWCALEQRLLERTEEERFVQVKLVAPAFIFHRRQEKITPYYS